MCKKVISVILTIALLVGCFSMAVNARQAGIGGGAESFNPVEFSQEYDAVGSTSVGTNFVARITDPNYKVQINSISAELPFLSEGDTSRVTVSFAAGTVVTEETKFSVTGNVTASTNSVVRYTVEYNILDASGNTVWKNLTGYAYGKVSGSNPVTGAIGTTPDNPGKLDDGAYFTSIDKLNSCYVQVPSAALLYELKTQHFFITFRQRRSETRVVSGNAPSTLRTYPVDWPSVQWYRQESEGTWLMWATPASDYYNFTLDMNANDEKWDDTSNTVVSTEMYYLDDWDRTNAKSVADKVLGLNNTFNQGFYVQKGKYTEESWNNFLTALDMAEQVMLAVPGANYGFKIACQNGVKADNNLTSAFNNLVEAPCDWTTYKDPIAGEGSSCGAGGTKVYTCICGKTKTEATSTDDCTPSDEWTVILEPNCTNEGVEAQLCIYCSNPVNTRPVAALGHEYSATVVPPSCLDEGYTVYTCIRGDHTYNDDFTPAKGHTPGRNEYEYPTAVLDGLKITHCADCDVVISTETVLKPEGNFVLTAQSNNNTFFTTVTNSDFETSFSVPKNAVVNTGEVDTALSIEDIPSLGIEDTVVYQDSAVSETGKEINLSDLLYAFEGATLSGKVSSKDSMSNIVDVEYKYNLTSADTDDLYVIDAIPESKEDAASAFAAITAHITSEKIKKDGVLPEEEEMLNLITNYINLPGTAYIKTGTTKLTFENPEEIYTFSKTADKPAFRFEEVEASEDSQIEIYLPVGTVFAVGNHKLTIEDFLTIRLSGCDENETVDSLVSDIQACQSTDEITEVLVLFFAELTGSADGNEIVLDFIFDPAGYVLTGTVESFRPYEDSDGTEITTVEVMKDGKRVDIAMVEGEGVKEFYFDSVPNGTYTLRVMKINHVDREYEITVSDSQIMDVELKIHLSGDINGDGKVNTLDVARANSHAKRVALISGYEYACADVTYDGKVNTIDVALMNSHAKKVSMLW